MCRHRNPVSVVPNVSNTTASTAISTVAATDDKVGARQTHVRSTKMYLHAVLKTAYLYAVPCAIPKSITCIFGVHFLFFKDIKKRLTGGWLWIGEKQDCEIGTSVGAV